MPVQYSFDEEEEEEHFEDEEETHQNANLPFIPQQELRQFVSQLSPTVRQFGVLTRVWRVSRYPCTIATGENNPIFTGRTESREAR